MFPLRDRSPWPIAEYEDDIAWIVAGRAGCPQRECCNRFHRLDIAPLGESSTGTVCFPEVLAGNPHARRRRQSNTPVIPIKATAIVPKPIQRTTMYSTLSPKSPL